MWYQVQRIIHETLISNGQQYAPDLGMYIAFCSRNEDIAKKWRDDNKPDWDVVLCSEFPHSKNPKTCVHEYETVYEDWEKERRKCKHCGDRFTLYDDEMK